MQKYDTNQTATSAHRKVQSSTTLNRRYVRRPVRSMKGVSGQPEVQVVDTSVRAMEQPAEKQPAVRAVRKQATTDAVAVKRSPKIGRFSENIRQGYSMQNPVAAAEMVREEPIAAAEVHPIQASANRRMRERTESTAAAAARTMTAKELKDQAIQKALTTASQPLPEEKPAKKTSKLSKSAKKAKKSRKKSFKPVHFGFGRVMLALSCAAVAVFAIVYFVNLNMPDLSLRVAAMQTGIEASYPNYVPRDYSLSDITSEDGKVTLNFKNAATGDAFSLVEETSSWDSNALLTNYVKEEYGENYTIIREQGLTLYVSGSNACWVNGGVVYKLNTNSGVLTKKQIKAIATSL